MSRFLIPCPFLTALLLGFLLAANAHADNNTHSNWTLSVSEGGMSPAPAKNDDLPEIAVVGSTVHVVWIADDTGGACNLCVIWYRRSRDNGKTWDPRVMIGAADKYLETVYYANQMMAVDNQNVVHIALTTSPPTNDFDGLVQYRRSKDGGTTWDAVKTLYDVNQYPWWTTISVISTDGVKTSIAAMVTSDRAAGGWIQLFTTADAGNTFSSTSVFGTATTDQGWYLLDAKRAADRTYVLYSDVSDLYGHVSKDYVAVLPDSGARLGPYLVSVPAKNGNHYATIWQGNNYSPKIAVNADKAYVVFGCQDANNVERAMMRRFTNYGASLDLTVITSDTDPDGGVNQDDVSVAANSFYGLMVYHVDTSDIYGGINKMVVKRYNEAQQAPVPAVALFNKQSYYRGSIYPTIMTGPAQSAYVMWQSPTLSRSADSFNSWVEPVEPQPLGTWSGHLPTWPTRLKTALGPDGTVH